MEEDSDKYSFLGQMFGPKGENEDMVVKLVTTILLDYTYWRKNYFPDDPLLLTSALRREYDSDRDKLIEATNLMVAQLRRSFPFYSPRYIAHQQSETTVASVLGALAGTLYNSNNVTTESGIATVEMEIDACNELLKLLGFTPMPITPDNLEGLPKYETELENNFGWCHLTSGGTVANIEALWVARTVKFFPLAVRDTCVDLGIELRVARPNPEVDYVSVPQGEGRSSDDIRVKTVDIRELGDADLLGLRPMEAIYLIIRLTQAIAPLERPPEHRDLSISEYMWKVIDRSPYSPSKGVGAIHQFKPRIFVSGAAHYSIKKAADLLGLGKSAVVSITPDENFRLDIDALRKAMVAARAEDPPCTILAVVGIAGTTEEGAVDRIDKLVALRQEWEQIYNESFWLHIDAAWGGFIRCLFIDHEQPPLTLELLTQRLCSFQREVLQADPFEIAMPTTPDREDVAYWLEQLVDRLRANLQHSKEALQQARLPSHKDILRYFEKAKVKGDHSNILGNIEAMMNRYLIALTNKPWTWRSEYFNGKRKDDIITAAQEFTKLKAEFVDDQRTPVLRWPPHLTIGRAFFAIEEADSVAIDPHKMGYTVYPNGAVAFKSDLVRHLIKHEAPYITSLGSHDEDERPDEVTPRREKPGGHHPIRYAVKDKVTGELKITTEAFAQYTLEGSRPSAAACSLWLSTKALPLNRTGHGQLIRSSLLSARIMAQYMVYWKDHKFNTDRKTPIEFCFFTAYPPDTNIVIFGVKPNGASLDLVTYNKINNVLYREFSILSEHGDRSHSYSQPFFLSRTSFKPPNYEYSTLRKFFGNAKIATDEATYAKEGVVVLRATVMNPYILPMKPKKDLIFEFMRELHKAAEGAVKEVNAEAAARAGDETPAGGETPAGDEA